MPNPFSATKPLSPPPASSS
ncbi:hypothetical protein LINPERPRIM_LOCUS16823 [Linum perenne]